MIAVARVLLRWKLRRLEARIFFKVPWDPALSAEIDRVTAALDALR